MNKAIKTTAAAAAILLGTGLAGAQNTYSGYFLDNYAYRFQMNPAFGNDKGFVSFPAIGNLNLAMRGNLHLSDVVYKRGGKTVLFTNPGIGVAEAMDRFGDKNRIGSNVKAGILSAGFKAFGGYNTVSIGANANINASVPKAFFSLAKEGMSNRTYDIKDMRGYADAYADISLGHSRDVSQVPGLRVGAALKFLIGAGCADFRFNRADLTLGHDSWTAVTNADIYASVGGLRFNTKTNDKTGHDYVSGANLDDGFSLNGFGMGLDLGAEYEWRDFRLSAAILDLGFMSWGKTAWASTDGDQTIDTDSYIFSADDNAANSFSDEWDRLSDDLSRLYELKDMGQLTSRTRALAATLNFGVDYEFPLYRKLHFGLVNSTRINGAYTWTQFRVSADVNPLKWVSASANVVMGTYGVGFGWLLNLHTTGFNFFVGTDHTMGKLSKQFVPLNSNADLNIGINFPF